MNEQRNQQLQMHNTKIMKFVNKRNSREERSNSDKSFNIYDNSTSNNSNSHVSKDFFIIDSDPKMLNEEDKENSLV